MQTFLNNISSVIAFLLNQLSNLTTSLADNYVFIIIIAVFILSITIDIIYSFIKLRRSKGSED